jgi:hypothetical protein
MKSGRFREWMQKPINNGSIVAVILGWGMAHAIAFFLGWCP